MGWLFNWRVWLAAFAVFYLIHSPAGAAGLVHKGTGMASQAGRSLSTFVNRL
jgi:hypothetical protein